MIELNCPSCKRKLKLADNLQGKQIRCPACKNVFRVEAPAAAAAAPVEAVAEAPPPPAPKPRPAPRPAAPPPADEPFAVAAEPVRPVPRPRELPPEEEPFAVAEEPLRPAPRRRAPPPPDSDFEDVAEAGFDRKQSRRAARGGAGALQMAFIFELIPYVVFIVMFFALGAGRGAGPGMGSRERELGMVMLVLLSIAYIVPMIFVMVGSSMLSSLRGRGMVITACVMAFILALELLVYTGFWAWMLLQLLGFGRVPFEVLLTPLVMVSTSLLGLVFSIIGGIRGLVALGKPEVRAAYR